MTEKALCVCIMVGSLAVMKSHPSAPRARICDAITLDDQMAEVVLRWIAEEKEDPASIQ